MATVASSDDDVRNIAWALKNAIAPVVWPLVFLLAYASVALTWVSAVGISVSGLGLIGLWVMLFLALGILVKAVGMMMPAGAFATVVQRAGGSIAWFAVGVGGAALTATFILPCNRMAFPFHDAAYARMDAALGFSWPHWMAFLRIHPSFNALVSFAYHTHIPQYLAAYFILAMLDDRHRAAEFFWSVNLSGAVTGLVSGLIPAVGAAEYFFHTGEPWLRDLTAARQSGPAEFTLTHVIGMAQMPSYHATLAALFIWSTRRTGAFGWAVAALNLAMIAGTPSEGSHYLVDILAGLGIAGLVIFGVNRIIYRGDRRVAALPAS